MQDISEIFKSYDIRGTVGDQLTTDTVEKIARCYANWLPEKGIVAVGHDMRADSKDLAQSFISGLISQGYDVWDIGLVTSDMIYFAVGKWNLAGGAVITASHNPGKDNGIKLYRDQVIAIGLDAGLSEIRDKFIANEVPQDTKEQGSVSHKSITEEWVDHCLGFIDELSGFNVAIDAGNGMAGEILPAILSKLPIRSKNMYFELDGSFPNHEANPQKVENLRDLTGEITKNQLDFGIAFDGDGDRAVFVDDQGRPVLGTDLMSIIAKRYLQKYPGAKIVHDVRTSKATQELIREWGGEPVRTKAGRVNIGSLMRKVGAPFGGETTGHMFFTENYDADSGLITALVAMQALTDSGKKLSELVDEYRRYEMPQEINIKTNVDKTKVFAKLKQIFEDADFDELDGLTVWIDKSTWFNLRASNTEPVMRLNAEAKTKKELDQLIRKVQSCL
ncbi:MAG: phosphomannomutase/phosphoglucomutase [Candidatus Saccharibacteria bacterium]|nr:phosphomannomutase/phosphoglucomutase [Candidatus Saccharibacteria bacterium]